jgi:hypothetical protein
MFKKKRLPFKSFLAVKSFKKTNKKISRIVTKPCPGAGGIDYFIQGFAPLFSIVLFREGLAHGEKLILNLLGRPVLAAGLHTELGQALQKLNRQVQRWNS